SLNLSLSCILAIWKGIEEFGLTLLNTKHLLYLSKFCRFFASSFYLCPNSNNHRNTKQSKELHTWGY
ncbi:hypothetical protein, partial [Bacteroides thetaiotaomicron]|uniref:hypothetical protein n=1 Tax=Bacteroides thetaiotaomicron TaxID=818 RepID=UPI0039C47839